MSGGSGICVKMYHVYGDKLWSIEPSVCLQVPTFDAIVTVPKMDDFPQLGDSGNVVKKTVAVTNPTPVKVTSGYDAAFPSLGNTVKEKIVVDVQQQPQQLDKPTEILLEEKLNEIDLAETRTDVIESTPTPTESPDVILKNAFLTVLKLHGRKLALPLLTSTFYRVHILPEFRVPFEIKNTSYKKLSKFLDQMSSERFIVIKEEPKGVEKITEINMNHPEICDFIPQSSNEPEEVKQETQLFAASVTELYVVSEETYDFFKHFNIAKGKTLQKTQIMEYLKDYVLNNKLQVESSSKKINLDATLLKIFELGSVTDMNKMLSALTSKMELTYEMRNNGVATVGAGSVGGKKPVIQITLATRSGNKKVTLINNLDGYGIIIPEFAKLCKLGVAASTSITRPPGAKSDQLLVQGNQVRFVHNLLTQTYKVQAQCITGLELAKKEKKKKN